MDQRLLMIAYYFPPLGGAGVQRSAKFAKYLARLGWRLDVVSVVPPYFEPLDPTLAKEVDSERITVHRIAYRASFRNLDRLPGGWRARAALENWLVFPDRMRSWLQPAYEAAAAIGAAHPGIPLFTTSAPYTAHLIGLRLKQRYGLPWIADFRDEWSQNPYGKPPTGYHRRQHQKAEARVLAGADAVISVTAAITAGLRSLVPGAATTFATIPNGFDPEDFQGIAKTGTKNAAFTITHVGTLNQERLRLLRPLLEILQRFVVTATIPKLRLKLVGSGSQEIPELHQYQWIESVAYLPHGEALAMMAGSDLVILAEANPAAFTGKIFEYLGLQLPILGLVHPDSPAAALIRDARAGWVAGLDPAPGLAEIVLDAYRAWEKKIPLVQIREDIVQQYNRRQQADQLAELIGCITKKGL